MADPIQGHTTALVSTLNPPQYVLAEIFSSMTSTTQKSLVPGDVALFSSGRDATNPLLRGQNTPSGTDPTSHWRPFRSRVPWGQFSFPCPAALGFLSWFPVPCCLRSSQPSHHWCLPPATLPKWDLLCALPVGGNPPQRWHYRAFWVQTREKNSAQPRVSTQRALLKIVTWCLYQWRSILCPCTTGIKSLRSDFLTETAILKSLV